MEETAGIAIAGADKKKNGVVKPDQGKTKVVVWSDQMADLTVDYATTTTQSTPTCQMKPALSKPFSGPMTAVGRRQGKR